MRLCSCLFLSLAGVALIFPTTHSVSAAVFSVPNGDVAALKAAITSSNINGEDDTIELAASGLYELTGIDNKATDGSGNGLPVVTTDGGHGLNINGNNATIRRMIKRAKEGFEIRFRIFYIGSFSNVTIRNLVIGQARSDASGAGIYNDSATVTLIGCNFEQNIAENGAGIFNSQGALTVDQTVFAENRVYLSGGAIFNSRGVVTVTGSTFGENNADNAYDDGGGAICNS